MLFDLFPNWNPFDYSDPFSLNSGFIVLFILIALLIYLIRSTYKELINTKYFRIFTAEYTLAAALFIVLDICITVVVFNPNLYSLLLTSSTGILCLVYNYKVLFLGNNYTVGQLLRVN